MAPNTPPPPPPPPYEIGATWSSSLTTDVQLNVRVRAHHFRITLLTAHFSSHPAILQSYLRHVELSDPEYIPPPSEEDDFPSDPLDAFYDWAVAPFTSLFHAIPPLEKGRTYTLRDCLFPPESAYTLRVEGDEVVPAPYDAGGSRPVGVLLPASSPPLRDMSTVRVYRPEDVRVRLGEDAVAVPTYPRKVYVKPGCEDESEGEGEEVLCFFKQMLAGDVSTTVTELATYAKMRAAGLGDDVRVSRLVGVVEDEGTGRVVGLLLGYVECGNRTLVCAASDGKGGALREKWAGQVRRSVEELHARGIVWGDAKPENVLVDENDDAWLIDFGGGYTSGWVDKELVNTQEGDLQGLQRIEEFLTGLSKE
ncbi:hypothetical protein BU24DRAFT_416667 [Aaosphaeria arxii CBS 175.79]|uniref:Protein kinase domain-containing protein n=1 Tax=Aaosphaeria arxii CBS 175.79 TaxID=1450172 RepID=A0A6A5Y7K7_9PLEO|nr:uncharacterized protein BU24DRAFT_416667 [Aaosphaeria arxii CBS 175.79]KAF2020987.1 hypothetical protein BU24DRAFT_416667 [Aaosphaeria arxii CBS 175.79]